jgi:hypothetical protein
MHDIFKISFAQIYPLYQTKVARKGVDPQDVDLVIEWLCGYDRDQLQQVLTDQRSMRDFFALAPRMNSMRYQIKGKICGIQIETIEDPLMKDIRYLDKLIDQLAKGKPINKIPWI